MFAKEKVTIQFELPVESYVAPDRKERIFSFDLTLWIEEGRDIECRITTKRHSHIPFHPHFEKKWDWRTRSKYAEWIGYLPEDRDIYKRVERMHFSLQYKPDYIKVDPESLIGNKEALLWYLKQHHQHPAQFAAGNTQKKHFEMNTPSPQPAKKFDISQGNTPSKKKFAINQETTFEPAVQRLPEFEVNSQLNSLTSHLESNSKIYITQHAQDQIFSHIRWGDRDAKETKSEQGGLLVGKVYIDEQTRCHYGVVEQGIPGRSANGSATYLEMTHETWLEMIEHVDHLLSTEEHQDMQIIGWYHTHPNELDVFMSGTDQNTQRNHFNQDWHFAIVLNPQKKKWKAFSGPRSLECRGFFMGRGGQSAHHEEGSASDDIPERRQTGNYAREQPFEVKKVLLLMALVILIITVFTMVTRSLKGNGGGSQKQVKKNEQAKSEEKPEEKPENNPEEKPTPKAVMPRATKDAAVETTLKKGAMLYDSELKKLFKAPLANPLKVAAQKRNDTLTDFEAQLFAYKDGVVVGDDLSLQISGKLRNTNAANSSTLVGELTGTITVSKEDYHIEDNWFKFKFLGVAKP